jgi:hypothetical protein
MSKTRSPAIDETTGDQVLPLRFGDSNDIFQKIALDCTFRFDDVLDPEKLHSALNRLLQISNWHQLGARYNKNVSSWFIRNEYSLYVPPLTKPTASWKTRAAHTATLRRKPAWHCMVTR